MPPKDFKKAMKEQRAGKTPSGPAANPGQTNGPDRLGVVGDTPARQVRQELEQAAEGVPVREIPLERLHDNPFQHLARPEVDREGLEELAASIRQNNFYGALLARRKRGVGDYYELAFGHRRRDAARLAGLKTLPVKVMDLSDPQMARIMASENFSRQDLTPLGEAAVIGYMSFQQNMSIEEIAQVVGRKRGWVQPRLALFQAPDDIKAMVRRKPETLSHTRLLVTVKDARRRELLIETVLRENLTYEQLKVLIERWNNGPRIDKKITNDSDAVDREEKHNTSPASRPLAAGREVGEIVARAESLLRLNRAAATFERLISSRNYQLNDEERARLGDIVERLSALLES